MIATLLVTLMMVIQNAFSGYIEKVEVTGCETCMLMLTCRQFDSIIAIMDVDFKMESSVFDTGLIQSRGAQLFPPDHPRDALNKRCSGVNHCSFALRDDSPGSEAWGSGNLTVTYVCATQDRLQRYCNSKITLDEKTTTGLLHNPGYPRFYAGQKRCSWKITALPHQKLKLRILDLALFDTRVSTTEECRDILEIKDTEQVIYSSCRQEHPPDEVWSASESVEVILRSRHNINARRGVLIYFRSVGCIPPEPPANGYMVLRNENIATYTCCSGLVFPDTQTQIRSIECRGATWNVSLPFLDCAKPQPSGLIILSDVKPKKSIPMTSELTIPIVIIVVLFAVNAVVIYYIQQARKKNALEIRDEELGTFAASKQ